MARACTGCCGRAWCAGPLRPPGLPLRGIACLGACSRSCSAALQSPAEFTCVFGDLPADGASAEQLLCVTAQHLRLDDGQLPWSERPERLRRGVVARLAPVQPCPDAS